MATNLMTPGVYIEEKNAFPGSAIAVETAIPVFIGYTEKAERNGKSLLYKPTRVTSLAVFVEYFGKEFKSQFSIAPSTTPAEETFIIDGKPMVVKIKDNHIALLFNAIRLFYYNGGSVCYILSVKTYGSKPLELASAPKADTPAVVEGAADGAEPVDGAEAPAAEVAQTTTAPSEYGFTINQNDFTGDNNVFSILEKEYEPTLIVIPDVIADEGIAYNLYQQVLAHCAKMQSRFGLFDVYQTPGATIEEDSTDFREKIGINSLNYGSAYYPFLKTSVVQPNEIDHQNLDASVKLDELLPESKAKEIVKKYNTDQPKLSDITAQTNYHQSLKAASPTYTSIMEEIRAKLNLLPPTAAIAGIFTFIDTTRGVWKSPANVSLSMVNEPAINVSSEEQQKLNIDVMSGKSINVIRPFPGIGTLVWGARTLDGNSQDWRYINVRRTLIMIEQSLKLATRSYVFEANDAGTWITISSMINNFLYNLWKQGALAGPSPEQAYSVQIGLGSTMTPSDILDGIMRITVMLAIVRPAEFIVLTFQQQQQQA